MRHVTSANGERVSEADVLSREERAEDARREPPRGRRWVRERSAEDAENAHEAWLDRIGGSA